MFLLITSLIIISTAGFASDAQQIYKSTKALEGDWVLSIANKQQNIKLSRHWSVRIRLQ